MHTTHREFADKIMSDGGFLPAPYLATTGATFEQRLEVIEGDTISPILPLRGEVCSGKFVWFSVDTDLSLEQREACRRVLGLTTDSQGGLKQDYFYQQPIKFSDFIELHSRYGNWAFRLDLVTLLENYRHSRKPPGSSALPDVYFKMGGTKRYKNTATYIIIVCAVDHFTGFDPLPNYPTLRRSELLNQTVFDPKGLLDDFGRVRLDNYRNIVRGAIPEFRPQGITVGEFDKKNGEWFYHDWDQLDFAFHFPSDCGSRLHCGVFPEEVHHSYCVPLKRRKMESCEAVTRAQEAQGGQEGQGSQGVPPHLLERFK